MTSIPSFFYVFLFHLNYSLARICFLASKRASDAEIVVGNILGKWTNERDHAFQVEPLDTGSLKLGVGLGAGCVSEVFCSTL